MSLEIELLHPWDVPPAEARLIQNELSSRVIPTDDFDDIRTVAGIDVGFEQDGHMTRAAVVVLSFPALDPVDQALAMSPTRFPYVPGLLSFREVPAVLEALQVLHQLPDLIVCDAQGLAHPRRFGLACHLGVLTDIPCIGAAKSRLVGTHGPLPQERGAWIPLMDKEDVIGAVVRTRARVSPIYVSVGHRIGLATAVHYVLACCPRYRIPETTRRAHRLASGP
jgi:deoxyribonuclease V